jgi:phage baseplate assembly protein W
MGDGTTYGINFPFRDSVRGDYLDLTNTAGQEIRADLINLLLTRKGSRYFLPDFGTRLYEFLFEPFDGLTFDAIESDIRASVEKYIPNLLINKISVAPLDPQEEADDNAFTSNLPTSPVYRYPGKGTAEYTAKIKIEYSVQDSAFATSDFVIINI